MNKILLFVLFIFMMPNFVYSSDYDKIIQFDMNDDIIITTTTYNSSGMPCYDCNCTLNIYNPYPNENFLNSTYNLSNKGNGVYTTGIINLSYNTNIYPITLFCYDSIGYYGGDNRGGIKVSATTFDYTAGIIVFVGISAIFLIMSFWMNKSFKTVKLVSFFSSLIFIALSLVLGYAVIAQSPQPTSFKIIFGTGITAFLMIVLTLIYFYLYERLEDTTTNLWNFGYRKQ